MIKIFILSLFAIIFLADAVEVNDDDINSPVLSYLLAKVHRLEANNMARLNTRKTRETTDKPTKPPVAAADNKQCNCPPNIVTYIRWGNSTCPYGADTIYSGVVGGSWYDNTGAAVDPLCLPPDPQYLLSRAGYQNRALLYGAEYQIGSTPLDHSHERNVPCALCEVYGRTNKIMIPSHYECPLGWRREYRGYLMAGYHGQKAATQYTCVDESLEPIPGSGADTNGYLFYTVEAHCNHFIPCSDKELTCVVCTK